MSINIMIADDHPLVREGLKKVLSDEPGLIIVAEAKDTEEVFDNLNQHTVDILLLDLTMPGKSGLDIIKEIKNKFPSVKILILSMHPEDRFALRSLKLGASGYLTKETAADELVKAIHKIFKGGSYLSSTLAEKLLDKLEADFENLPHEILSDREFEVFRLIASGKSISQISSEINLSVATVSTYRARILEKMKMKSNAEITYYAITNNLIN